MRLLFLAAVTGFILTSCKPGASKETACNPFDIANWKQEEGKWKLFLEIWNTDHPPPVK